MTRDSDIAQQIPLVADLGVRRGRHCPELSLLAAYTDAKLETEKLVEMEGHLADCTSCLNQVGFLVRTADLETPAVPGRLLDAVRTTRSLWFDWFRRPALTAVAAAAAVILAITLALHFHTVSKPTGAIHPEAESVSGQPTDRRIRNGAVATRQPLILVPAEGAVLEGPEIELRWQKSPRALAYRVLVVNLQGDVVWEGKTADIAVRLPANGLVAGERHFVWVEARLPGGGVIKSAPVGFRLAPK